MRVTDLKNKNIVIWGLGCEGKATAGFIRLHFPNQALTFVDEDPDSVTSFVAPHDRLILKPDQIEVALVEADVIIKSPGVSVYHPMLRGKKPTSLLNLWMAEPRVAKTICVTGTKGKSTTSALLVHTLQALGEQATLLGNIGVPVTEFPAIERGFAIIEVSSYQAATLAETCDLGIVTSLYPEHLDWHKSLQAYYRDKLNLLGHSRVGVINADARETARQYGIEVMGALLFNHPSYCHVKDGRISIGGELLDFPANTYLSRAHNLVNVLAALTVLKQLDVDPKDALLKMADFEGLPHRQQELGEINGVLYVDDSISTTPQSAIAALEVYASRTITLLVGGFDRGITYSPLIDYIRQKNISNVICMGDSGRRIYEELEESKTFLVASLQEAVTLARKKTLVGGVVLLSPAAPSYGMFKDFKERGRVFTELARQE